MLKTFYSANNKLKYRQNNINDAFISNMKTILTLHVFVYRHYQMCYGYTKRGLKVLKHFLSITHQIQQLRLLI